MKIIIDIPEETFSQIKDGTYCGILNNTIYEAIQNGITYKGKGRWQTEGYLDGNPDNDYMDIFCSNCEHHFTASRAWFEKVQKDIKFCWNCGSKMED